MAHFVLWLEDDATFKIRLLALMEASSKRLGQAEASTHVPRQQFFNCFCVYGKHATCSGEALENPCARRGAISYS